MATSGAPEEASLSSLSGMVSWVPLNLSDRWALGLVLTILGRYRVNRMANGMDGIVGKRREGRRRSRKYLVPWGRGTTCTVCGCTVYVHSMVLTQDGTSLAHTEYPALLSITAQLGGDEVGRD